MLRTPSGLPCGQSVSASLRLAPRALPRFDASRHLESLITRGDRSPSTLAAYNHDVARVAENIDHLDLDPWSSALEVPTHSLQISGDYFETLSKQDGIGAPLAVIARNQKTTIKHDLTESSVHGSAHVVLRSSLSSPTALP